MANLIADDIILLHVFTYYREDNLHQEEGDVEVEEEVVVDDFQDSSQEMPLPKATSR